MLGGRGGTGGGGTVQSANGTSKQKKTPKVETKQALSATDTICPPQENEKHRGSAVTGTPLGIAPNATCCIITARMRRFVTCSASLDVPQRKHVMPTERHRLAKCFDQSNNYMYEPT